MQREVRILPLPRTRTLSWSAVTLEYGHQLVLSLWIGGLAVTASLVVPVLLDSMAEAESVARALLNLMGDLSLVGCGAGSFLLLTSLLMHLLSLRPSWVTGLQTLLLFAMTGISIGLEVGLAPRLADLLRTHPDLFHASPPAPELRTFQSMLELYTGLMLGQAALGAALLLLGVRRWYRYVARSRLNPWQV